MKLIAIVILMALAVSASAGVYTIKPSISNDDLMGLYTTMLARYCQFAESRWRQSAFDPSAGYWGNGLSGSNEGIRAVTNTALAYATALKQTGAISARLRPIYTARAAAGIRYAAATHLTGKNVCVDNKQWGKSWQSAMYTGTMCMAAWLLWDDLDAATRAAVERVTVYEANILLERTPKGSEWGNTIAEENGWDLNCIAAAPNLFPNHPNADKWRTKCLEFMMNTVSVAADENDATIVDGRPVKDWVCSVNYHPDFTLENHGFFHPSYAMVSPAEVGSGALFFAYGGKPIPKAAGHHLGDTWNLLQTIMLPHGFWAYTQGMDWAINSDGHIHYLAFVSTYLKDPVALGMEKLVAQYIRGHQMIHGGKFAGPSSRIGFAREAITAERLCYAYLWHKLQGFGDAESTIRDKSDLCGVRDYPQVEMMSHRTPSKFASFSWRNKVMGLVMPIGPGNEASPFFATPLNDGMVGTIVLKGMAGKTVAERKDWHKTPDGFESSGSLVHNDGALRQELRFVSVGARTVLYSDQVTALKDVAVSQEQGLPYGIENDEYTGNVRRLYYQNESRTVRGLGTEETIRIPGNWANVDGRIGIVVASGSGMVYKGFGKYNRDGALQDVIYGSFSDAPREFAAGQQVARRVAVFFTDTTPAQTARLAKAVRIEKTSAGEFVRFTLPEGGERKIAL